jgi:hypothetical protein
MSRDATISHPTAQPGYTTLQFTIHCGNEAEIGQILKEMVGDKKQLKLDESSLLSCSCMSHLLENSLADLQLDMWICV